MADIVEVDRLENFPHPRDISNLLGLKEAERALFDGFMSGKMHHAWIISGQKGIGKASLAYKFAQFILEYSTPKQVYDAGLTKIDPSHEVSSAHQIRAQSHPSLFVLKRQFNEKTKKFGQNITIENVRKAEKFLHQTVEKNTWRIVIIDSADDLNRNSANALLKSIEEPPENLLFLIISSMPAKLLPTIRSRCRMLKVKDLSNQTLVDLMQQYEVNVPADELDIILFLSQGSFARILELIDVDGLEIYKRMMAILDQLPNISREHLHKLASELALKVNESKYLFFLQLFLDILARFIKFKSLGAMADQHLSIPNVEINLFERLSPHFTLDALFALWEDSEQKFRINSAFNMDKKQTIITEFLQLEKCAD